MTEENGATKSDPKLMIDNYIHGIVLCTVRGVVGVVGVLKPDEVLLAICRVAGRVMGEVYGGETEEVEKLRNQMRAAFAGSLHQTPIVPLPRAAAVKPVEEVKAEAVVEEAAA